MLSFATACDGHRLPTFVPPSLLTFSPSHLSAVKFFNSFYCLHFKHLSRFSSPEMPGLLFSVNLLPLKCKDWELDPKKYSNARIVVGALSTAVSALGISPFLTFTQRFRVVAASATSLTRT